MFDQEQALLPATQPIIETRLQVERISREVGEVNREIRRLTTLRQMLHEQQYAVQHPDPNRMDLTEAHRRTFVRACAAPDCRGFLSTQWKCGLCEQWTCPTCNELKGMDRNGDEEGVEHVCHPDNIASAALIRQDTKPCPSCGMGIFRIAGCNQMFCTHCHTGFCWRTGRIETNIHNPHYFEWMNRQNGHIPRNPMEIRCGRNIDVHFVRELRQNFLSKAAMASIHQKPSTSVIAMCRSMIHLHQVELPRYRVDHVLNNQELRIKYMRNQLTEEKFKTQLQRDNKKHRHRRGIFDIIQMVDQMCTDILYRFMEEVQRSEWSYDYTIIDEIPPLIAYANECLVEIGRTYNSLPWKFTHQLELVRCSVPKKNRTNEMVEAAAAAVEA